MAKKPIKKGKVVKAKAKAVAKNVVNINIGNKSSKRKSAPKKAAVVQNMPIHTSPTIYNPAPTPFQISAPQPPPISSATEVAQEFNRLMKTREATAIQPRDIMELPHSALPSGAFEVAPQFNNMEVPSSFSQLETQPITPQRKKGGRPKGPDPKIQQSKEEARRVLDRVGVPYNDSDSLGTLQQKYRAFINTQMPFKKDPFV